MNLIQLYIKNNGIPITYILSSNSFGMLEYPS